MDHFAGLDVSVKATSVCIVDDAGKVRKLSELRFFRTGGNRYQGQKFYKISELCMKGVSLRSGPLGNGT